MKINLLVPTAAAAVGVTTNASNAIADSLLAITTVTALNCAELSDGSGKFIVFATVFDNDGITPIVRPVAGSDGNIKLYGNSTAALRVARFANLAVGAIVRIAPYARPTTVGDPLDSLKTRYANACKRGIYAVTKKTILADKINNAVMFGWDVSSGATLAEYNDLISRHIVLEELETKTLALVTDLGARLTTAGIDPATVATAPNISN
jgi:hypothetical protein